MQNKRGMFIVLEGIDGSGKETQMFELARHIKAKNKYQDVILTHEPWRNLEIKRKLKEDKDAYSDSYKMAELYIKDRTEHVRELISPNLEKGAVVLCGRYMMSTCAYQWTQGANLDKLFEMHEGKGIILPDLTFFVYISAEIAQQRRAKRAEEKEKFEDLKFQS